MSQYFPPYRSSGDDIKVKLDLSNYASKTDLRNITHIDASNFASKTNLASLKSKIDELDINKLKIVPTDLSKLSDAVKNEVIKKTGYNKLVTKVDNIDTKKFVLKTKYEKDGSDFEDKISKEDKKIPDVSGLVKKTDFNTKVTEIEGKISSISGLATNSALTAAENKIPNKQNMLQKIVKSALDARYKDLVQKSTCESELKKVDDKVSINSSNVLSYEHKLKQREDTINDLERDSSYFRGKNYFGDAKLCCISVNV